jgi:hypothetical protein
LPFTNSPCRHKIGLNDRSFVPYGTDTSCGSTPAPTSASIVTIKHNNGSQIIQMDGSTPPQIPAQKTPEAPLETLFMGENRRTLPVPSFATAHY